MAHNGKRHCVWGGTSEGSVLLKMWIDFSSTIDNKVQRVIYNNTPINVLSRDVCPKKKRGQYFEIRLPNRSSTEGHGRTWWRERPFNVKIWK